MPFTKLVIFKLGSTNHPRISSKVISETRSSSGIFSGGSCLEFQEVVSSYVQPAHFRKSGCCSFVDTFEGYMLWTLESLDVLQASIVFEKFSASSRFICSWSKLFFSRLTWPLPVQTCRTLPISRDGNKCHPESGNQHKKYPSWLAAAPHTPVNHQIWKPNCCTLTSRQIQDRTRKWNSNCFQLGRQAFPLRIFFWFFVMDGR